MASALIGCSPCAHAAGPLRILLPTVPSSGSTWLRSLLEVATGRVTESVYARDGGTWSTWTKGWGYSHGCSAMNYAASKKRKLKAAKGFSGPSACANVTRLCDGCTGSVVLKTHWPSLARHNCPKSIRDHGPITGIILLQRSPKDVYCSHAQRWRRPKNWTQFLISWRSHYSIWKNATSVLVRVGYSDLCRRPVKTLATVLTQSGISNASVADQNYIVRRAVMAVAAFFKSK